jgi:protease II
MNLINDIGNVRFSEDEKTIAFTVSSDTSPADVFVADLTTGRATRLTHALNPAIDENALVEATIVRYPGEGGVMIPAVLYKPKGASAANPAPAIVLVHGGPGGQTRRGYSAMVQHLVNHGYAVLGANNRGSSGYGKTFFHLDDKKHGEADLRDIVTDHPLVGQVMSRSGHPTGQQVAGGVALLVAGIRDRQHSHPHRLDAEALVDLAAGADQWGGIETGHDIS